MEADWGKSRKEIVNVGKSKALLASAALGAVLLTTSVSIASAAGGNDQGGNNTNQGQNQQGFKLSATPELDSLLLFGTGLVGVAGYGALRWRSRRRDDPQV
jgi:hypothetical protein